MNRRDDRHMAIADRMAERRRELIELHKTPQPRITRLTICREDVVELIQSMRERSAEDDAESGWVTPESWIRQYALTRIGSYVMDTFGEHPSRFEITSPDRA